MGVCRFHPRHPHPSKTANHLTHLQKTLTFKNLDCITDLTTERVECPRRHTHTPVRSPHDPFLAFIFTKINDGGTWRLLCRRLCRINSEDNTRPTKTIFWITFSFHGKTHLHWTGSLVGACEHADRVLAHVRPYWTSNRSEPKLEGSPVFLDAVPQNTPSYLIVSATVSSIVLWVPSPQA